jgi:ankyrin repeat protein
MECKIVTSSQRSRDNFSDYSSPRFRWVVCQLETLRRSVQRDLRGILERLPRTLDETYERVLKGINEDNRGHARRLLHCLAFSFRPLRVEELAEILTFDFDNSQRGIPTFYENWRWKDVEEAVLSTCSSLIAVVDHHDWDGSMSRVVQYSHFSVSEFLTSDRLANLTGDVSQYHILPGPAHTILAQACLGFLLHLNDQIDEESVKGFPLAEYAAMHWFYHAQFEDTASRVKDGMQCLLDPNKPHLEQCLKIFDPDSEGFSNSQSPDLNHLYYASFFGFHVIVEHLIINHPWLVNAMYGSLRSPLLAALSGNHVQVAELLLRHGGKVDSQGRDEDPALHIALEHLVWSMQGNVKDVVSFLLSHGADVNSSDEFLYTPLHMAAEYRHLEEAQILIERGADINARAKWGSTPLHCLLRSSHEMEDDHDYLCFVRLLLEHGAKVNAQDEYHTTPLHVAMLMLSSSHRAVQILLEYGAKPDVETKHGYTASLLNVLPGNLLSHESLELVRFFLEYGANVDARELDENPLLWAMSSRQYQFAELFLEYNAEPNVADKDGRTPLCLLLRYNVSPEDRAQVLGLLQSLLKRGANVNAQDGENTTPLHLTMELGFYEAVRDLLEGGALPNMKDNKGKTPLHLLLEREYHDHDDVNGVLVVGQLLLESGADVNAQDEDNTTPLYLASNHRNPEIAQIILDHANAEKDRLQALLHLTLEGKYNV